MSPIRIALVLYLLVLPATFVLLFGSPDWPAPAVDYYSWAYEQQKGVYLTVAPIIGIALQAVGWLSAAALLFGMRSARWSFAIAVGALLVLSIATVFVGQVPVLLSPLELTLNDIGSVLAGIIMAVTFFGKKENGAP